MRLLNEIKTLGRNIKGQVLLLLVVFSSGSLRAQQLPAETIPLYISKQSGQFSIYSGTGSKTTDQYETGSVVVTADGPVLYSVTPNEFSIGTNQTKTWNGKVWGDVGNGPAPGSAVDATITGSYTVTYSRPNPAAPTGHEMVNNAMGTKQVKFSIISLNVETIDKLSPCKDKVYQVPATGYPAGGTWSWTGGAGVTITAGGNTEEVSFKCTALAATSITAKYTVAGVSYSKTIDLTPVDGPTEITGLPEILYLLPGETKSLTPVGSPNGGSYQWVVAGPITLQSGPYNYVAFIKATQTPGEGSATVTYKRCDKTISKTVKVIVKDCKLDVADSLIIIKGQESNITGYGSPQGGTYAWTVAGAIAEITGGANTATATIKGLELGKTTATISFTANGCNETKTVGIRVVANIMLTLTPATPGKICKGFQVAFVATGTPPGGTYSWAVTGPFSMQGQPGTRWAWATGTGQGNGTISCTYTFGGQSVTRTVNLVGREIKNVEVTANPATSPMNSGTQVTYTAKVYDMDGNDVTSETNLTWEKVYYRAGLPITPQNSTTLPLGDGTSKTTTWTYVFGGQGAARPDMEGFITCYVNTCNIRIGSVWVKVKSPN